MKRTLMLVAICTLTCLRVSASNTEEDQFIWNEANSIMSSARDKAEFRRAAATYNTLVIRGSRNAPLFYNMGTALLLAGDKKKATYCLDRAERYEGRKWEITRNLILASSDDADSIGSLPWYRYPLFWHYALPVRLRLSLAIYAYTLFWLLFSLRRMTFSGQVVRYTWILAASVMIVMGSSALTTIHMENVASPIMIPQPSNSESSLSK